MRGQLVTDQIRDYLDARLDDYLAELEPLVNQDSGSYDKAGVDIVTARLQDRFERMGFAVERAKQERFGDDLIARRHGKGGAKIMLLGHADTVFPAGTTAQRPMSLGEDRIFGPGTCDMKAGILAGIYAIDALDHVGWDKYGLITFLIVSDEEIGERHSVELLMREGEQHDAVLTLEAARENGDIVTARKAGCWLTVTAQGKAAHAGVEPEKGRSATLAIANIIVNTFALNGRKPGMTVNPERSAAVARRTSCRPRRAHTLTCVPGQTLTWRTWWRSFGGWPRLNRCPMSRSPSPRIPARAARRWNARLAWSAWRKRRCALPGNWGSRSRARLLAADQTSALRGTRAHPDLTASARLVGWITARMSTWSRAAWRRGSPCWPN